MQDFKVSPYTRWLSNDTPWHWGAFRYPDMTVFAPIGILANGETRSVHADEFHDQIVTAEQACEKGGEPKRMTDNYGDSGPQWVNDDGEMIQE